MKAKPIIPVNMRDFFFRLVIGFGLLAVLCFAFILGKWDH
jgi:hypothetical protein